MPDGFEDITVLFYLFVLEDQDFLNSAYFFVSEDILVDTTEVRVNTSRVFPAPNYRLDILTHFQIQQEPSFRVGVLAFS